MLPTLDGRLTPAGLARFGDPATAPTAILATHECIAATLYDDLAGAGLEIGRDVSVVCTFPAVDTRSLVPALSHFSADLDAVGIALADTLIGLLPDMAADRLPTGSGRARSSCPSSSHRAPATGARRSGSQRDPGAVPGRGLHAGLDEGDAGDAVLEAGVEHLLRHRLVLAAGADRAGGLGVDVGEALEIALRMAAGRAADPRGVGVRPGAAAGEELLRLAERR